jgi:hypothetical protein
LGTKAKPPLVDPLGGFAVEGLIWINTPHPTSCSELCGRAFLGASSFFKLRPPARWPFFERQKAVKMPSRPWTEGEIKRANLMRAAGYSYSTIDKTFGRPAGATQRRLEIAGHGSGDHVKSFRASDKLLAERAAREVARNQRSLTQNFCGDPPPGYSALHGKTGLR